MDPRRFLMVALALVLLGACGAPKTEKIAKSSATPRVTATPEPTATPTATPVRTVIPAAAAAPSSGRCRYVFPVQPPSATHYGASHHDYPATDIFAPKGTRVVSPVDGVVDYVSRTDTWDPKTNDGATRGGLSVAIIGRDGNRYYGSHMLDIDAYIASGVHVSAGGGVGHVDSTGDARGISPHLHFGISHPTTPTDWQVRRGEVSPYRYLNDWRKGIMTTPTVPGAKSPSCVRTPA